MDSSNQSREMTNRENQVFQAFRYLSKTQRLTPTQRELAKVVGCDVATVNRAIKGLEAKGYVKSEPRKVRCSPRSYTITNFKRIRNARTS